MQIETTLKQTLFMALELSNQKWKLAFATAAHNPRQITIADDDAQALREQIERAKVKFGLPAAAPVKSCYEAGRDGFWVDRLLKSLGVDNLVVDSASIEVDRRARRAKTDRLDADKLVRMLIRYWGGETRLWGVARVPSEAEEDERRLHRERERLIRERTAHRTRIRALWQLQGVRTEPKWRKLGEQLDSLRNWDGKPLFSSLHAELQREAQRLDQLAEQLTAVNNAQAQQLAKPQTDAEKQAANLHRLRAVGPVSALVLSKEFFGWRDFRNRREVGGLSGLTGAPYNSGCVMPMWIDNSSSYWQWVFDRYLAERPAGAPFSCLKSPVWNCPGNPSTLSAGCGSGSWWYGGSPCYVVNRNWFDFRTFYRDINRPDTKVFVRGKQLEGVGCRNRRFLLLRQSRALRLRRAPQWHEHPVLRSPRRMGARHEPDPRRHICRLAEILVDKLTRATGRIQEEAR